MKEFRYKTSFASKIRCLIDSEKDKFLAQASLKNLKGIIPDELKDEADLLCIAFNAFTPNLVNKNGAMVDTNTALKIYKSFINKPINNEHSRNSGAIGHIVSSGFSKFDINYVNGTGSELLESKAVKDLKEPFNVCLSGVLYRLYANKLIDYIEESNDPNSDHYMDVSASWELMFNGYFLAIGSKYLEECEIIKDEAKISELSKYLLNEGGTGKTPEGKLISMLINGDEIIAAGIGLTQSPAGELKGIVTDSEKTKIQIKSSENEEEKLITCNIVPILKLATSKEDADVILTDEEIDFDSELTNDNLNYIIAEINKNVDGNGTKVELKAYFDLKNSQISNSQDNKSNVTINNDINKKQKTMLKSLTNLKDEDLKEATASEIVKAHKIDMDTEIEKISEKFVTDKNKVDVELKASNDKVADLEKKYKEGQDKLNEITENINKLVKTNTDREQEEVFNTRMNYFDSEYDLSEEKIRNIVARKIKNVDEKQYTEAKEEIELLLAAKKKSNKVFDKKTMKWVDKDEMKEEKKEVKASTEEKKEEVNTQQVIDDAIDKGEKTKTTVAATTTPTETQVDKWAKAFGEEGWEIDKRAFRK